jgi:hypothetical protein
MRLCGCGIILAAVLPVAVTVGCAGSRFGSDLPAPTHPQALRAPEGTHLCLPQDRAFSIAVPQVTRKAGLDGRADADATCSGEGSARATAEVIGSGEATALFQLGHAFANELERQVDLEIAVRYRCVFEAFSSPESGAGGAQIGLRLYARESRGPLLRELVLVQYGSEAGPARRHAADEVHFTLTLAPGAAVDVFLAGQVRIDVREGRTVRGSLELSDVELEATARPAPAISSDRDGRPQT